MVAIVEKRKWKKKVSSERSLWRRGNRERYWSNNCRSIESYVSLPFVIQKVIDIHYYCSSQQQSAFWTLWFIHKFCYFLPSPAERHRERKMELSPVTNCSVTLWQWPWVVIALHGPQISLRWFIPARRNKPYYSQSQYNLQKETPNKCIKMVIKKRKLILTKLKNSIGFWTFL